MLIFDPKIVRIGRNRLKWTAFKTNRLVLTFKRVLKIVIFLKIIDGDPTKITKSARKVDELEVNAEKH